MQHLVHLANILYLLSYNVRDIMLLRVITILAMLLMVPYFLSFEPALWAGIGWNTVFLAINCKQIFKLRQTRRPVFLSPTHRQLYEAAFSHMRDVDFEQMISKASESQQEQGSIQTSNLLIILETASNQSALYGVENFILDKKELVTAPIKSQSLVFEWVISDLRVLFKENQSALTGLQTAISNQLAADYQA